MDGPLESFCYWRSSISIGVPKSFSPAGTLWSFLARQKCWRSLQSSRNAGDLLCPLECRRASVWLECHRASQLDMNASDLFSPAGMLEIFYVHWCARELQFGWNAGELLSPARMSEISSVRLEYLRSSMSIGVPESFSPVGMLESF
ncbi:hypothetical protein Nepgr_013396 [Nepenthes gracilis]|uniref:Uncharacterized protein n=1 Tax=Nepenthes gracilis TaxID=150966 RepID=A0AAD3SHC7_NEPGR|nr:hypothetical protein Nepgr_013396 [Nepenthes gracilis]